MRGTVEAHDQATVFYTHSAGGVQGRFEQGKEVAWVGANKTGQMELVTEHPGCSP